MAIAETGTPDALQAALGMVRRLDMDPSGRARIQFEAARHMCHSGGVVQGGFVAGWLDTTMAQAAMMLTGAHIVPMTLEMKVSFFEPARPGPVIAEGWVERAGRATCFAESRLLDPGGVILAKASATLRLVPRDKVEAASRAAVIAV